MVDIRAKSARERRARRLGKQPTPSRARPTPTRKPTRRRTSRRETIGGRTIEITVTPSKKDVAGLTEFERRTTGRRAVVDPSRQLAVTTPLKEGGTVTVTRQGRVTLRNRQNKITDRFNTSKVEARKFITTQSQSIQIQARTKRMESERRKRFPTPQERVIDLLRKQGKDVKIDEAGNIIATFGDRKLLVDTSLRFVEVPKSAKVEKGAFTLRERLDKEKRAENIKQLKKRLKDLKLEEIPKGKTVMVGNTFVIPGSDRERKFLFAIDKVIKRDERFKGNFFKALQTLKLDIRDVDKWFTKALKGAGTVGVTFLFSGAFIANMIDKAVLSGRGLLSTQNVRESVKEELKRAKKELLPEIGRTFDPRKPENWANLILVIAGFKPGILGLVRLGTKASPRFVPSVRSATKMRTSLKGALEKVKASKKFAQSGIRSKFQLTKNRLLLRRLIRLEVDLNKSLKTIAKIIKNPKILKVQDMNPMIRTADLLKILGKEEQIFHTSTARVKDLFGRDKGELKPSSEIIKEISGPETRRARVSRPDRKITKARKDLIERRELVKKRREKVKVPRFRRLENLKRLVSNFFANSKLIKLLTTPKSYFRVKPQPKGMGVSRMKFSEDFLFFDLEVPTGYAYESLVKNMFPQSFIKFARKVGFKDSFLKRLNNLKTIKASDRFVVLTMETRITLFPRSLQRRINLAKRGRLSQRQVDNLRRDIVKFIKANPGKIFVGSKTASQVVGEREVVAPSGTVFKKVKRRFSIDPDTKIFFDVVELTLDISSKRTVKSILSNFAKSVREFPEQIRLKFTPGDLSKVRRFNRLLKRTEKLTSRNEITLVTLITKILKSKKAVKPLAPTIIRKKVKKPRARRPIRVRRVKKAKEVAPTAISVRKVTKPRRRPTKAVTRRVAKRIITRPIKPIVTRPRKAVTVRAKKRPITRPKEPVIARPRKPVIVRPREPIITRPRKKVITKPAKRPITVIAPKKKVPPIRGILPLRDEKGRKIAYDVLIKSPTMRARFTRINAGALDRDNAIRLGRHVTDQTPKASFLVRRSKKRSITQIFTKETNKGKFRARKGRTKLPSRVSVEKRTFRIDQGLEKLGITVKGLNKIRSQGGIIRKLKGAVKRKKKRSRKSKSGRKRIEKR